MIKFTIIITILLYEYFKPITMTAAALTLVGATACSEAKGEDGNIIDKPDFHSETGIFDIDALEALGRVSSTIAVA